jgi:hypothetical protein
MSHRSERPDSFVGRHRRRYPRCVGAALALGVAASTLACATGAERIARSGVEGGLGGALEALNEPRNRELLLRLLRDPDIQEAAHDLTEAITGGAVDGLSDEARMQRIREASDAYIRTISGAVGAALDEDISPAVTRGIGDVVGGTVAAALRPENARLARSFVDGVTRSTITAFMQSTAQGLRDDLGPALNLVLERDLGPGLQRVIEDNVGPALRKVIERDLQPMIEAALGGEEGGAAGMFARDLTRQIVLGANDGMSELGISLSPNSKDGIGVFGWIPIVLAGLLLLLSVLLVRMFMTRRAITQDRARSEEMLVNILRAIKSSDEPGAVPDFNTVIARARQHIPNLAGNEAYLATIITRAQLPAPLLPSAPAASPAPRKFGRADADEPSQRRPPAA